MSASIAGCLNSGMRMLRISSSVLDVVTMIESKRYSIHYSNFRDRRVGGVDTLLAYFLRPNMSYFQSLMPLEVVSWFEWRKLKDSDLPVVQAGEIESKLETQPILEGALAQFQFDPEQDTPIPAHLKIPDGFRMMCKA
jgi:hypothetical protein